ncbi:hypothetical protein ACFL1H_08290 [Nanoarchaeota archaeon]
MNYKTKSVIIGRKKRTEEQKAQDPSGQHKPCFIKFFDINDPHKTIEMPKEELEFFIDKAQIDGLDIKYLLAGNDLVINDLEELDVEEKKDFIVITGKQKKE